MQLQEFEYAKLADREYQAVLIMCLSHVSNGLCISMSNLKCKFKCHLTRCRLVKSLVSWKFCFENGGDTFPISGVIQCDLAKLSSQFMLSHAFCEKGCLQYGLNRALSSERKLRGEINIHFMNYLVLQWAVRLSWITSLMLTFWTPGNWRKRAT